MQLPGLEIPTNQQHRGLATKILRVDDAYHGCQEAENRTFSQSWFVVESDQIRMGRDKYFNRYETSHLQAEPKTGFDQGGIACQDRQVE